MARPQARRLLTDCLRCADGRVYFPVYQNEFGSTFGLCMVPQLPVFGPLEYHVHRSLGTKPEKCKACKGEIELQGFDNALACESCDESLLCGHCARGHDCPHRAHSRPDWDSVLRLDWMLPTRLRPEERWNVLRLVKLNTFPTEAECVQFGHGPDQPRECLMAAVAIHCLDDMPPGCSFPTALVITSRLWAAIASRGIQQPRGP